MLAPRQAPRFVLLFALPLIGCGPTEEDPAARQPPGLVGTVAAGTAADTARVLVARQRELFALLKSGSTGGLGEYVDFSLFAPPGSFTRVGVGTGRFEHVEAEPGAGYLALVNGHVPDGIDTLPDAYRVRRIARDAAVVTTVPDARGMVLSVAWRLRSDGWRATRIDVLTDTAGSRTPGPRR